MSLFIINADGGSRGNPGPAGWGLCIHNQKGEFIGDYGNYVDYATNNFAEYNSLIDALTLANKLDLSANLYIKMDSKLVVSQMTGAWAIKNPDIKKLAQIANELLSKNNNREVKFEWVPRSENFNADAVANLAMDSKSSVGSLVSVYNDSISSNDSLIPNDNFIERNDLTDFNGSTSPAPLTPAYQKDNSDVKGLKKNVNNFSNSGQQTLVDNISGSDNKASSPQQNTTQLVKTAENTYINSVIHGNSIRSGAAVAPKDKPLTTLIFVRHGETKDTPNGIFSGAGVAGPPLSEIGIAQVKCAGKTIARTVGTIWKEIKKPSFIVSSPIERAMNTANEISKELDNLNIVVNHNFAEVNFGKWEGLNAAQVEEKFPGKLKDWTSNNPFFRPDGGESLIEIKDRVGLAIEKLVQENPNKTIIVATHLLAIRAAIATSFGFENWLRIRVSPANMVIINYWENSVPELVVSNLLGTEFLVE